METHRRILILAGYGGHAGYAFSIAWHLHSRGIRDNLILVARGYEFLAERFKGLGEVRFMELPRKPAEPLHRGLHRWIRAFTESAGLVGVNIGVVFAAGSNFSLPPSITLHLTRRTPIYTLEAIEHFTKKSRAVLILEKLGARVFLHWEEQLELFPRGIVTGPVYEPRIYEPYSGGYILVTTGTLGYKGLFDALSELKLERIVLQTGDIDPEPYTKRHPSWIVFRYTTDIHKWIAGADLVITQQGLTAAIAALAYGKPVIIVYNPRVTLGAPRRDIEIYSEKLGATYLEKPDAPTLREAIEKAEKPRTRYPNGATEIAKILTEYVSS